MSYNDDDDDADSGPYSSYEFTNGAEFSSEVPEKRWLIRDVVPEGTTILYGDYSAGKSFVALDMAAAIALGRPWLGHYEVQQGPVVYIVLEGNIEPRWYAYRKEHGLLLTEDEKAAVDYDDPNNVIFKHPTTQLWVLQNKPVHLANKRSVDALIAAIKKECERYPSVSAKYSIVRPPKLIVFETLSRTGAGMVEETTTSGMQTILTNGERVAQGVNARGVLFTHHTTKTTGVIRGSGVVSADPDAQWYLEVKGKVDPRDPLVPLVLTNDKMREGQGVRVIELQKREITLHEPAAEEEELLARQNQLRSKAGLPLLDAPYLTASCIIEPFEPVGVAGQVTEPSPKRPSNADRLYAVLEGLEPGSMITRAEWITASGIKEGSFNKALKELGARVVGQDGVYHRAI